MYSQTSYHAARRRAPQSLAGKAENCMSVTEQRFQSFITRVRPHRVAVLTNVGDVQWQHSCIGILQFFTKLWGGSHCVIIPTDGQKIDEEFWAVLSSHDPDILYKYRTTGADLKDRVPAEFEKLVADEVTKYAGANGLAEGSVRGQIEKAISEAPLDEWNVTEELRQQLLIRVAPFHFEKQPEHGMPNSRLKIYDITRGSNPRHPLTAIADVLRAFEKPKNVAHIDCDVEAEAVPPPLWLAATIGSGDDHYFLDMNSINIGPQPILMSQQNVTQVIKWGISPRTHLQIPFPMGLTRAALIPVISTASRRFDLPTVVVVGDSIKDFCLYHALYWQQGRALWLPPWFMPKAGEYPDRLMSAILEAEESIQVEHSTRLVLVSYSVPKAELEDLQRVIQAHLFRSTVSVENVTTSMVAQQVAYPSRVFADGNIGDVTTHLLLNDSLPGWFESPVPRRLHPVSPLSHRWLVDITFMEHLIPRHPVLGSIAVTGSNVSDARAGSGCVSYMCPGFMVIGDHMETNMLRPSIHVPDAEEIFRIVLEECGYQSKTSDKGRYEAETVRRFGGLENAGYALWSKKHRTLLMKFLDKSDSVKDVYDEGVYLKDRRRYLNFASILKILGSDPLAREIIDEYVEKGIFYRGYIFLCKNCSDAAWHSISEVDQTFTCRRCALKQQYKFASWKHPNEPSWFYKLDEMIYLMLEHNGHVPVLTLNKLRVQSKESFLFRPEIRITPKGSTKMYLEVDLCCIANGRLCIGEAKSNNSLAGKDLTPKQTAERYRDLALKIGASMVIFSTTEPAWNQSSSDAMRMTFEGYPHIEVLKLSSTSLYS